MNELFIKKCYHTFLKNTMNELSINELYPSINLIILNQTRENNSYWIATNHILTWIDLNRSKTLNLAVFSGEESCDPPCSILTPQTLSPGLRSCSSLSLRLVFWVVSRMRARSPFLYYFWTCSPSRKFNDVFLFGFAKPCPQSLDRGSTIFSLNGSRRPNLPLGAARQGWRIELALLETRIPVRPNFP